MKKLLLGLFFISGIAQSQMIVFTDADFKNELLAASPSNQIAAGNGDYMKIDANNDNEIQVSEASGQWARSCQIRFGHPINGII